MKDDLKNLGVGTLVIVAFSANCYGMLAYDYYRGAVFGACFLTAFLGLSLGVGAWVRGKL